MRRKLKVHICKSTWWRRNEYGVHDTHDCFDYFTTKKKAEACALELTTNDDDGELVETFVYDMEVL